MFRKVRSFAGVVTFSAACALFGTQGCAAFTAAVPIVSQIVSVVTDAIMVLDAIDKWANMYFAVRPNPVLAAKYDTIQMNCRDSLQIALRASNGVDGLTEKDAAKALEQFKIAYARLEDLLDRNGMRASDTGAMSAIPGIQPLIIRDPMAVNYKVEK